MLPFLWHGLQSSWLACIPVTGTSQMACGKEFACQCRRCRFDPWVGKIPLRKGVATHSSILAWRIPWNEEPGGLQSMGCRVGWDWVTEHAGCLSQHLVGTKVRGPTCFPSGVRYDPQVLNYTTWRRVSSRGGGGVDWLLLTLGWTVWPGIQWTFPKLAESLCSQRQTGGMDGGMDSLFGPHLQASSSQVSSV